MYTYMERQRTSCSEGVHYCHLFLDECMHVQIYYICSLALTTVLSTFARHSPSAFTAHICMSAHVVPLLTI